MDKYLRGQIVKMANISPGTLRYYEKEELLPKPERTQSGYRLYSEDFVDRIQFIRAAKNAGLTLQEIRRIITKIDRGGVDLLKMSDFITNKITEIDSKITAMQKVKEVLLEIKNNINQPDVSKKVYCYFKSSNKKA
jgi:DNA-binding transcriptional MerR regulator